jgi:predicted CXXCH cytochrome family protein
MMKQVCLMEMKLVQIVLRYLTKVGLFGFFFLTLTLLAWLSLPQAAAAQQSTPATPPRDLSCRLCHSDTQGEIVFPSGERVPAQVDLAVLAQSAHGYSAATPLTCNDCHRPINDYQYPHAPLAAVDYLAYRIEKDRTCENCHTPHLTSHPGRESATPVLCADCHTAHDVLAEAAWYAGEATLACLNCHESQERGRLDRVIRAGLFAEDKPNTDYCLACHSQPGLEMTLASGERLSLTIQPDDFHNSVHGVDNAWQPLTCTDCHENYRYPHEPITIMTVRDYNLVKYAVCASCHEQNYDHTLDSVHGEALALGVKEAAVCTDCHGAHDTTPPDEPRARISLTCEQCHSEIFREYADSVHGAALLVESNPDVPTCVDCHGVHTIEEPTTAIFRASSPQMCGQCHADSEIMARYDISTDVFDTYVADFHGTTVTLFEHQDPAVETNKAVCYDCHGVHDIKSPDDPEAGIKANLLQTCQECHPDATANFPDSWTSHFRPSLQHNPTVYLVNLFYQFMIPSVLGFLGFLVLTDVYRRVRLRYAASREELESASQ